MLAEQRLGDMNVVLPGTRAVPPEVSPRSNGRPSIGGRVNVSGHEPLVPDGRPASRLGRVPTEVSLEHAK